MRPKTVSTETAKAVRRDYQPKVTIKKLMRKYRLTEWQVRSVLNGGVK